MHAPDFPGAVNPAKGFIFAVDDAPGDLVLLAKLLEQTGLPHPCRSFSSGGQLMDALLGVLRGAPAPLACFVDVKMAGMSGFDVLRWIRCQDGLDAVPVIMLSSSDDPRHPAEACGIGAQCYARKFPSVAELGQIIAAARRYSADRAAPDSFHVPCNLLTHPADAAAPSFAEASWGG